MGVEVRDMVGKGDALKVKRMKKKQKECFKEEEEFDMLYINIYIYTYL